MAEVAWLLLESKTYQGKTALIVGRDHAQNRNKLLKDLKTIFKGDREKGVAPVPRKAYRVNMTPPISIEFWNGSRMFFYSHGSEDQLDGLDSSVILLDEANKAPESMYYTLIKRLGREGVPGKFIICANSTNRSGWLFEKFWEPYEKTGQWPEDTYGVGITLYDNKFVSEHRIKLMEREFAHSKVMFERAVLGLFSSNEGLVYGQQFDRETHVINSLQRPKVTDKWTFYAGLDFGYKDPTAYLVVGYDPESLTYYVIDEYCRGGARIEEHALAIKQRNVALPKTPQIYSDHDKQARSEYAALGIPTSLGNKELRAGIDHLQTLFAGNRLLIFDNCKGLIKALECYEWGEKKDVPKSHQDDHLLDALRYALYSVNNAARSKVYLPTDYSNDDDEKRPQFDSSRIHMGYDDRGQPWYVSVK